MSVVKCDMKTSNVMLKVPAKQGATAKALQCYVAISHTRILIETESDIDTNVWNRWHGTCAIPIYQVLPCLVIYTEGGAHLSCSRRPHINTRHTGSENFIHHTFSDVNVCVLYH